MVICSVNSQAALTGDAVLALEERFNELLGQYFSCLSVANATCGISATLRCLPPGKVLTPLFTSPATIAGIKHAGHKVVFCDVDPISACLSPTSVHRHLCSEVRAIVCVNVFGHQGDLKELRKLANEVDSGLLIVDAAQSLGTALLDPGYLKADVVVFSIGPNKLLSCPDGGIIAVKKRELWEKLVRMTQHVLRQILEVGEPNFEHFNSRMNPYSAQQALVGLQDIKERIAAQHNKQRHIIAQLNDQNNHDALPANDNVIFEPLTILPRGEIKGFELCELPLPNQEVLAEKHDLPETLRQFRFRKTLTKIR